MIFMELVKTSLKSLFSNKLRTFLTTLGIIIGIMAVITLLNLGESAQKFITNSVGSLGSNLVSVIPGRRSSNTPFGIDISSKFTIKEIDALLDSPRYFFSEAAAYSSKDFQISEGTNTMRASIAGVYGDYWMVRSITLNSGRKITETDNKSLARVAVIGTEVAKNLFPNENPIGKRVKVNGVQFTIVGINAAQSSLGFTNPNAIIYIPLQTYQKIVTGEDRVQVIYVKAKDENSVDNADKEVTSILRRVRGLEEGESNDFSTGNSSEILTTISSITGALTAFLITIGAISLLVGGIGIMNIMFVTVRERTREIGLRKALGARNVDILLQFLTEAVVITIFGGIIGTVLGVTLSLIIARLAGFEPSISIPSIVLSVGVSGAIGLIFGIYPAKKASELSPIEALRFE